MKYLNIIFLVMCSVVSVAQTFQKRLTWKDDSFKDIQVQWVDVNNDSLLDIVATGTNQSQSWQIKSFKNQLQQGFVPTPVVSYPVNAKVFALVDVNRDNRTDIVAAGEKINGSSVLTTFTNGQNFTFTAAEQSLPGSVATLLQSTDLDNDGRPDLIISDRQSLKILKSTPLGYELSFDSAGLDVSGIAIRDFNADGQQDIIVSGLRETRPFLFFMNNKGRFRFKKKNIINPVSGVIETGDVNHDGQFDFIVSGVNTRKSTQINFYRNTAGEFQATDSIMNYAATELFLADLNSDGQSDLYFSGKLGNGNRFNRIRQFNGGLVELDTTGVRLQRFGDYDRDGDLDLFSVVDSASYFVFRLFENTTLPLNASPSIPALGFAISTTDRTFIYWEPSTDDHTPQASLTYDLTLSAVSGSQVVSPEYDLSSQRRKRPVHGLQTTNRFAVIKGLTDQRYTYNVQSVDNAFNGSKCSGGGGIAPCFDIKHEYVQACKGATIELAATETAQWFSAAGGSLGIHANYSFVAAADDTLYSFVPQQSDCSKHKIWIIHVNGESVSLKSTKYACKDFPVELKIPPGWKDVTWKRVTETLSGDHIAITITQPETIVVTASGGGTGCTFRKEFNLLLSTPVLTLNGDAFTINKGQSVTLSASGARDYLWQPPTGLSNSNIANPSASPASTTEYTVIASDSIGCKATGKVIVYVEEQAFIPNLFTPNGDGTNDEIKIYGITSASKFRFAIFNREGNLVYETQDIDQATRTGWNGTSAGVPQSGGLYYWKVEGTFNNGKNVTLNGKSTGSILLVK